MGTRIQRKGDEKKERGKNNPSSNDQNNPDTLKNLSEK